MFETASEADRAASSNLLGCEPSASCAQGAVGPAAPSSAGVLVILLRPSGAGTQAARAGTCRITRYGEMLRGWLPPLFQAWLRNGGVLDNGDAKARGLKLPPRLLLLREGEGGCATGALSRRRAGAIGCPG